MHPFLNSQLRWQSAGRPFSSAIPLGLLGPIYISPRLDSRVVSEGVETGDVRTVQSSSPCNIGARIIFSISVSPAGSVVKGSK